MTKRFIGNTIYAISMLLIIVMRIFVSLGILADFKSFEADAIWSSIVQVFLMGVLPLSLYLIYLKIDNKENVFSETFSRFQYNNNISRVSWCIVAIIAIMTIFITTCVSSVWSSFLSEIGYKSGVSREIKYTMGTLFLDILMTACLPAFCEEFTNRGLLYYSNIDNRHPLRIILLTAFMFALMHTNIRQVAYTFVFGLIAGALVCTTKSIWPAMLVHFLNNVESVIISYAFRNDKLQFVQNTYNYLSYSIIGETISSVLFIIFAILMFILFLKLSSIESEHRLEMGTIPNDLGNNKRERFDNVPLIFVATLNSLVTIITLVWGIIR